MLCACRMMRMRSSAPVALALLSGLIAACAGGSDRYPSLSLRDFERVEGQFAVSDSGQRDLNPAQLPVDRAEQVREAVEAAHARHSRFLTHAEQARDVVVAAVGSGQADKRWSLAMVEIADLDSRLGATTSLLADLDALYTSASLEFQEREEIAEARTETSALVAAESLILQQLVDMLIPAVGPPAIEQRGAE